MAYKVFILKRARENLWDAMEWYNEKSPGLGHELMKEFFEKLKSLRENPQRFKYIFKPFRRALLKRFPYKIIFRIDEKRQRVVVVVLWHEKRDAEQLEQILL